MKLILSRLLCGLAVLVLTLAVAGCGPDFYLSESEAAAYAGSFSTESSANNFIMSSIVNQTLDIQFDNTSQPPTIRSTNLATLMRNYTTMGLVEGINHQVQLDRLNGELQKQVERWIRNELQLYTGVNNAGARLSQLTSIQVRFLNKPTFTFHPERQSIAFTLSIRLTINGTVEVDVLDTFTNLLFGVNGNYPLTVDINNFNLSGEAALRSSYADAGDINFALTPQPGAIAVIDTGTSSAPGVVKDGIRTLVSQQLSQPLAQTFTQRYDYFALISLSLTQATRQTPSTLSYTYSSRPEVARPMLHIAARAADGKLYHLRKTEGGQGIIASILPFPNLQTRIENEPALFASATDQLELAATTTANELVYAHWRDETWINQATFAPGSSGYTGKPTIVATQPGQLDIIVTGRSGGLWHLRRLNGRWLAPAAIGLGLAVAPIRDPVAVQVGSNIVLAFVDAQNHLFSVVFNQDSSSWGASNSIPTREPITFAPAAAAGGNGRVDVVYVGTSGTPYHRILEFLSNSAPPTISVIGNETSIGGSVNATPALVCSSFRQLEMVGRGTDNRLYHNHYVGPDSAQGLVDGRLISQGWQGWTDLNGNFSGSLTFEKMSAFSIAATRTGKVLVTSIRNSIPLIDTNAEQLLYHNSYDSERFGTQPWKTVLWRGYEQVGSQRFVGQPALAVIDRNMTLGDVSNAWTLQGGRLAESNYVPFHNLSGTQINSTAVPSDPVIVSSLPGALDSLLVGTDGRLHFERRSSRGTTLYSYTFPAPADQPIKAQPAVVGYGNGQLELVAVAQNNVLYHWRFRNGSWTAAVQLTGTVISQPILIHLGGGQLAVLAVGGDQGLYLWSFANGGWSPYRQIVTGFPIRAGLFGPLAASSWGEGSVDLALVDDRTAAVYHGRIGGGYFTSGIALGVTPSRAFTSVGGIVTDTPVLTAFSPTRLNLLTVGTDSSVYSNWAALDFARPIAPIGQAPAIVWSGYSSIGGNGLLSAGVAKTGANELIAAGIDREGRIKLSRYNGGKWVQFQPVIGQDPQTQLSPPRFRAAVTNFHS